MSQSKNRRSETGGGASDRKRWCRSEARIGRTDRCGEVPLAPLRRFRAIRTSQSARASPTPCDSVRATHSFNGIGVESTLRSHLKRSSQSARCITTADSFPIPKKLIGFAVDGSFGILADDPSFTLTNQTTF